MVGILVKASVGDEIMGPKYQYYIFDGIVTSQISLSVVDTLATSVYLSNWFPWCVSVSSVKK